MVGRKMNTDKNIKRRKVGFEMSTEDALLLNKYVAMTGLSKNEFIRQRILLSEVKVYGNPKVYYALKSQMLEIIEELKRIEKAGDLTPNFISLMQFTMNIYDGMKEEF